MYSGSGSAYRAPAPPTSTTPKFQVIYRSGQRLDPNITTSDEVDHKYCQGSVFSRILTGRTFLTNSNARLGNLRRLPQPKLDSEKEANLYSYEFEYAWIIDTFCLLDYQVLPFVDDSLSQFKMVTSQGKERLPRPRLDLLIPSLRFDISALSEMLRRDLCTILHPDNILQQSPESLLQRFRIICAIQNLYAEHSVMLAPQDNAFFFRSCNICSVYDPEIIRFSRDLHCILLSIFHGKSVQPPSCRSFTPHSEMTEAEMSEENM